jgi:hypothetical protein
MERDLKLNTRFLNDLPKNGLQKNHPQKRGWLSIKISMKKLSSLPQMIAVK